MGEGFDERTRQPAMLPSGEHASACFLASYAGGRVRESVWSLNMSGSPGSHDNDKREDSSGGRLWLGVAEWLGSGLTARAATEESYGSSPGSSSGVSCLWLLCGP